MPDYDGGFKIAANASGAGLARLAGLKVDGWTPIPETVQTTERLADKAFKAKQADTDVVVYMEAYTVWVESAPWSVLAKSALLSEKYRLPTRTLVFILRPKGYRELGGTFRLEAGGEPASQVWFREVPMWRVKPEPWWDHHPGLMALLPLCDHGVGAAEAVASAAESIKNRSLDKHRRADLLGTLAIFGKLMDETIDPFAIIGRKLMHESPIVQEWVREGEQKGVRRAVRSLLVARFGERRVKPLDKRLDAMTDLPELEALLRKVADGEDLAELKKLLPL